MPIRSSVGALAIEEVVGALHFASGKSLVDQFVGILVKPSTKFGPSSFAIDGCMDRSAQSASVHSIIQWLFETQV
ncbi:hypothetical protein CDL60_00655 [Roseateles noduli]|nr:hypothetical protein CDL60_00655 [Roseateles noduli]